MAPVLIPRGDNIFLIASMVGGRGGEGKKGEVSENNRRRPYMDLISPRVWKGSAFNENESAVPTFFVPSPDAGKPCDICLPISFRDQSLPTVNKSHTHKGFLPFDTVFHNRADFQSKCIGCKLPSALRFQPLYEPEVASNEAYIFSSAQRYPRSGP